jgi:hypothetical protein
VSELRDVRWHSATSALVGSAIIKGDSAALVFATRQLQRPEVKTVRILRGSTFLYTLTKDA